MVYNQVGYSVYLPLHSRCLKLDFKLSRKMSEQAQKAAQKLQMLRKFSQKL